MGAHPLRLALDTADIQGDILRPYGTTYECASHAFVSIECAAAQAREWLRDVRDHVTTATPWPDGHKPTTTLNVAMTATGLAALGVAPERIAEFSTEFRAGMAGRAAQLGAVGAADPAHWAAGLGTGRAHVLLVIKARTPEEHQGALGKMEAAMAAVGGVRVIHHQDTKVLDGGREHFGFSDGFAQPVIEGAPGPAAPDGGTPMADGSWRAVAPGEFILGVPDEETRYDPQGRLPKYPTGLGRNGTYVVWCKFRQDVARWRRTLREAAALWTDGDEAKLGAKIVGRWTNGAPLAMYPDQPPDTFDNTAPGANDFRYSGDPHGLRCPVGAHVRRSNPRDALGWGGSLTFRHRMIRRGMPYGERLADEQMDDDGVERGLVFVCYQASISRQFEGVQLQWLNAGNIFGLGNDSDFFVGDGRSKMTVQGRPPFFVRSPAGLVTIRGGEYLFAPGMTALSAIVDGTAG